jgi:hypothetical protein
VLSSAAVVASLLSTNHHASQPAKAGKALGQWLDRMEHGDLAKRVKAARRKPGSTWHLDEMFVTLRDEPYLQWRAVDERGTSAKSSTRS